MSLPSPTALAHAIRFDGATADELALEHTTNRQRIIDQLACGGFDATGYRHNGQVQGQRKRRLKDSDNGHRGGYVHGTDRPVSTEPARYGPPPPTRDPGIDWSADAKNGVARKPHCRWCGKPAEDLVDDMCPACREAATEPFRMPDTPELEAADIGEEVIPADVTPDEPDFDPDDVEGLTDDPDHQPDTAPEPDGETFERPRRGRAPTFDHQAAMDRYQAGEPVPDIAASLGCSAQAIYNVASNRGIKRGSRTESVQPRTQDVQPAGDTPEQIQGRRDALLTDLARPRRSSQRTNAPLRGTSDDSQMSDPSGENPAKTGPQPDPEPADAPQMQPVDTNEGSNEDPNATPDPASKQASKPQNTLEIPHEKQARSKPLASDFETSNEPASAASRAKSTGHTHGNGGTCHSLHARQFDATAALLLRAKQSQRKRTQALGERINDLLIDLRDRLDDEDQARRKALEAERVREEAKAEVARLEEQLREARAKARGHNRGYADNRATRRVQKTEHPASPAPPPERLTIPTEHPTNAGRPAGGKATSRNTSYSAREVRQWCRENGVECPARGRFLPKTVLDAYYAANPERRPTT